MGIETSGGRTGRIHDCAAGGPISWRSPSFIRLLHGMPLSIVRLGFPGKGAAQLVLDYDQRSRLRQNFRRIHQKEPIEKRQSRTIKTPA